MELKRKYIAYLDILGFKDLVNNNTPERVYELYEKTFSNLFTLALTNGIVQSNDVDSSGLISLKINPNSIKVNSLFISDSIIVWTDDNSLTSFITVVEVVRTFLNYMFITGIPLRGSIVEGHLDKISRKMNSPKDNSQTTLIGKGLVSAYVKEGLQNWSGCVVDESCINAYNNGLEKFNEDVENIKFDKLIEKKVLLKYNVPYKNGKKQIKKEEIVINWTTIKGSKMKSDHVAYKFNEFNKGVEDKNVKIKIKNTTDFINYANERNEEKKN